jgi:PTS system fructose-specific IIC component
MSHLLAVVSCPDRPTQTLLAAEALRTAARALGHEIAIETRGASGVEHRLSALDIQQANAILLIGEGEAEVERFTDCHCHLATLDAVMADAKSVLSSALPQQAEAKATTALSIVAITSCPTGIAHTFMAAEGLTQGAAKLGHHIKVETQGSVGAQNTLSAEDIQQADLVIIAADTQVELSRFAGKRIHMSGTKAAIGDGAALVQSAIDSAQVQSQPQGGSARTDLLGQAQEAKAAMSAQRSGPYRHLMTGVSYMLPFVVAGGILIALAFALGGIYVYDDSHKGTLGWALFQIGAKSSFALMVPILAGYIAYSIADRPGITPGMVGGMLAASMGAGFLGGIVAGFVAGYSTDWLNRHIKLPRNLEGLKPMLILPVLSSLLVGLLMIYLVGTPVAGILAALTGWLKSMQGSSAILLGAIIGAMMAFDLGGPVNKAAYASSTALLASQVYTPMAAAMAAGMTPPLGLALATWWFSNRFTRDEREAGKAAAVLGISFITEGAIPFAARDPLRVIPALMLGSALTGAMSMALDVQLRVPHGGVFVLPIPNAVTHLGAYLLCLVVGTVVTALLLRVLKKPVAV